jgi:type IV secretion system protein VirB1
MLVSLSLDVLLRTCAPSVGPKTLAAIVSYESGGHAAAIGDNTARRSYFPAEAQTAERLADRLIRAGHDVDLGLMQLNLSNARRLGLSVRAALDPCTNLAAASAILSDDYRRAAQRFGPGQPALFHALSAYNAGGFWAGRGYARGVYGAAAALRFEPKP